jgi:N-acetylneuraminic acid mutarotase
MMHSMKASVAALVLLATPNAASPGWSTAPDMPTPRRGAVGSIIKSKLVVVAGNNPAHPNAGRTVEIYDPLGDEWTNGPDLTVERSDAAAAPVGNKMFVVGGMGRSGGNISSLEYLDFDEKKTAGDAWTWHNAAPLPEARRGLAMAPVVDDNGDRQLYAMGGMNCLDDCYSTPVDYTNRVDIYDVAKDAWRAGPAMNVGRRDHGSAVIDDAIYVVGGCGGDGSRLSFKECDPLASMEMYNTTSGEWTMLPPMPAPRHGMHVASFGTDIIVLGGTTHSGIDAQDAAKGLTNKVLWFDTIGQTWDTINPAMPDPRDGVVKGYGLQLGIVVFVVGGSDAKGNYVGQTDQYALRC